jgi:hypothetical protein
MEFFLYFFYSAAYKTKQGPLVANAGNKLSGEVFFFFRRRFDVPYLYIFSSRVETWRLTTGGKSVAEKACKSRIPASARGGPEKRHRSLVALAAAMSAPGSMVALSGAKR